MNFQHSARKKKAIVLGGSFAGLMTAKVLSDHYEEVIILEKDAIHHYPESRKGQPHTKHLHGLLPKGLHILCDYFPGLFSEIVANSQLRTINGSYPLAAGMVKKRQQMNPSF